MKRAVAQMHARGKAANNNVYYVFFQNKKYNIGVKRAVAQMHARGKAANVLDIGTGTGLLSMMAAACGADTVTACEVKSHGILNTALIWSASIRSTK